MARILAVHGIAQQLKGAETLANTWSPALRDGMRTAGVPESALPAQNELRFVFYGDLFRPKGKKSTLDPSWRATDIEEGFEQDLLQAWWLAAALDDPSVPGPEGHTKVRSPSWVQRAVRQLSSSPFFAGMSERLFVGALKQVRAYFTDPAVRAAVQERTTEGVGEETRLIIGHSLGSVVAYEALCAHPQWPVTHLITLGSPLGLSNIVFDRLKPRPTDGKGAWPGPVHAWVNIADRGDIVASVKTLVNRFGPDVQDRLVYNGARAHDVRPYLTAAETGDAVASALRAAS